MKLIGYCIVLTLGPLLTPHCSKTRPQKPVVQQQQLADDTLLDYGYFTVRIPKGSFNPDTVLWRQLGRPSAVGRVMLGSKSLLGYEIGDNSMRDVSFPDPWILSTETVAYYLHDGADTNYSIVSNRPDTIDKEKYRFYDTRRDTIDGIGVKVFYPRVTGYGFCGIYSDTVPASSPLLLRGKRISITTYDADSARQALVFKCIRSIKFK